MDLEIRHLRLVQAISEEQSVTRAGRRLHLTQSALSHQLRDIEQRLGASLFWRMNKRMVATPAGERLVGLARQILGELERAEREVRSLSGEVHGVFRFATHCYTCYTWLPALLQRFHQRYPKVELRIELEATRRPVEALLEGQIELALTHIYRNDARLRFQKVFEDELVAVLSPRHPLAGRGHLDASHFAGETLILHTAPADSWFYKSVLVPAGVTGITVSVVQLTEAILEMVRANMGITVLASWIVQQQVRSGQLVALPITRRGFRRDWNAVTLRRARTPDFAEEFIHLLSAGPGIIANGRARSAKAAAQNR